MTSFWVWLDRYLGRGSYRWLKPLNPRWQYTQLAYTTLVDQTLKPGTRWLDAGAGRQAFQVELQKEQAIVGRAQLAVAADLCHSALTEHRSIPNAVCCSLDRLPFADGSIDLITLNMVAEHLQDPVSVFSELSRALTPNGALIVHTPHSAGYIMLLTRLLRRMLWDRAIHQLIHFLEGREDNAIFPTYYRANTPAVLNSILRKTAMTETQCFLLSNRPVFYFAAPLCALELLLTRLLFRLGCKEFLADNILALYTKHAPQVSPTIRHPRVAPLSPQA